MYMYTCSIRVYMYMHIAVYYVHYAVPCGMSGVLLRGNVEHGA